MKADSSYSDGWLDGWLDGWRKRPRSQIRYLDGARAMSRGRRRMKAGGVKFENSHSGGSNGFRYAVPVHSTCCALSSTCWPPQRFFT